LALAAAGAKVSHQNDMLQVPAEHIGKLRRVCSSACTWSRSTSQAHGHHK